MKKFILLLIVAFAQACLAGEVKVNDEIQMAMALGQIQELNELNPEVEKNLLVRLYQIPNRKELCNIEISAPCRFNYLVSIATFDEYPDTNIFKLNLTGEVQAVKWLPEVTVDTVALEILVNSVSRAAVASNQSLKNEQKKMILKLDPEKFSEKAMD